MLTGLRSGCLWTSTLAVWAGGIVISATADGVCVFVIRE